MPASGIYKSLKHYGSQPSYIIDRKQRACLRTIEAWFDAFATEDEALQQLEQRATDLSLVVDLSPGSLALRAASMEADVLYYSWQHAVSMFKRVVGDEVSSRVQPVAQVSCTHSERISAPVSTSSSRLQDRRGSRHSRTRSN